MRRFGVSPAASAILDAGGLSRGIIKIPGVATVSIWCRSWPKHSAVLDCAFAAVCELTDATTTGVRGGMVNGQVTLIVDVFCAT